MSNEVKMTLLRTDILIKPIEKDSERGGLIIPDVGYKEAPRKAKVVGVSREAGERSPIKKGDTILYEFDPPAKWIRLCYEDYIVMPVENVYGLVLGDSAKDIHPLTNKIFLDWDFTPQKYGRTKILRPDTHRKMHCTGTVVAVGPEIQGVEPGDRIFFDQFCSPGKFEEEGKRFAFIRESDALAIIPERCVA